MKNSITAVCMRRRLRIDASIARFFRVGASFINRMLRMDRDEESANHRYDALSLDEEQLETLQAAVEVCPGATLEELQRLVADQCSVTVSQISIYRALKQLNLHRGALTESRGTRSVGENELV
jgi:transposase